LDFIALVAVIKAFGKGALMELAKNKWIKFCIGLSFVLLSLPPLLRAGAELALALAEVRK
jgi:hypothetical protein